MYNAIEYVLNVEIGVLANNQFQFSVSDTTQECCSRNRVNKYQGNVGEV